MRCRTFAEVYADTGSEGNTKRAGAKEFRAKSCPGTYSISMKKNPSSSPKSRICAISCRRLKLALEEGPAAFCGSDLLTVEVRAAFDQLKCDLLLLYSVFCAQDTQFPCRLLAAI